MRVSLDVPYVEGVKREAASRQALDVYAPASGTGMPVIVYIHGGGWRYWDRKGVDLKPAAFAAEGFVFVSVGYRLVPEVRYRGQCSDVARGLRWIRDHIAEFGGSPERLHLMGFSAGAPMAGLVVADPQYLESAGVPLGAIQSVTGLDGDCYDIPQQIRMTDAKTREYHESVWGEDPAGWADPSPITHLGAGVKYPPFLLVHLASREDSKWQANAFAERYREAGGTAEVIAADTTHGRLNAEIGREGDPMTPLILGFVKQNDVGARSGR